MALLQITEPGMSTEPHQHRLAVGIDLGTTNSAAAGLSPAALFAGFLGTTPRSDFPRRWLIVVRPKASRCALRQGSPEPPQQDAGSPGSRAKCFRACAGSVTARGPGLPCQCGSPGVAFGTSPLPRHPGPPATEVAGHVLRGSIPGLRVPLSTLRPHPHGCARMTRGRRSWLSLQRMTLSFTTLRRF